MITFGAPGLVSFVGQVGSIISPPLTIPGVGCAFFSSGLDPGFRITLPNKVPRSRRTFSVGGIEPPQTTNCDALIVVQAQELVTAPLPHEVVLIQLVGEQALTCQYAHDASEVRYSVSYLR